MFTGSNLSEFIVTWKAPEGHRGSAGPFSQPEAEQLMANFVAKASDAAARRRWKAGNADHVATRAERGLVSDVRMEPYWP